MFSTCGRHIMQLRLKHYYYLFEQKTCKKVRLRLEPDNNRKNVRPFQTEEQRALSNLNLCSLCRSLPWGAVLRVWDMFFFEGVKVLFKVALAVLNLTFGSSKAQKQIPGFFELTRALRNLAIDVTHEDVLVPEVGSQ